MKAQTEKLARSSPHYARLLSSAQQAESRRRELARFLARRRKRLQFRQVLRDVRMAG